MKRLPHLKTYSPNPTAFLFLLSVSVKVSNTGKRRQYRLVCPRRKSCPSCCWYWCTYKALWLDTHKASHLHIRIVYIIYIIIYTYIYILRDPPELSCVAFSDSIISTVSTLLLLCSCCGARVEVAGSPLFIKLLLVVCPSTSAVVSCLERSIIHQIQKSQSPPQVNSNSVKIQRVIEYNYYYSGSGKNRIQSSVDPDT